MSDPDAGVPSSRPIISVLTHNLVGTPLTPLDRLKSVDKKFKRTLITHSEEPASGVLVQVTQNPSNDALSTFLIRGAFFFDPRRRSTNSNARIFPPRCCASTAPRASFQSRQHRAGFDRCAVSSKVILTLVRYLTDCVACAGGVESTMDTEYDWDLLR